MLRTSTNAKVLDPIQPHKPSAYFTKHHLVITVKK